MWVKLDGENRMSRDGIYLTTKFTFSNEQCLNTMSCAMRIASTCTIQLLFDCIQK